MTTLIFAGTPVFAAEILKKLIDSNVEIAAVLTQPDRPAGRGQKLQASPVKSLALTKHIPVLQPETLKKLEIQAELATFHADAMIVAAYGLILPPAILALFPHGCINVHASLLPRWRGAAPIQRAILSGDTTTGVGIMQMKAGLDTGPVYAEASIAIEPKETGGSLHDKLAHLGADLLVTTLPGILSAKVKAKLQDETAVTYAHKIEKAEAQIHWKQPAYLIDRQIRAFNPWPGAFSFIDGKLIKIWEAHLLETTTSATPGTISKMTPDSVVVACGEGALCLTQVQIAGGNKQSAAEWQRGHANSIKVGACFSSPSQET